MTESGGRGGGLLLLTILCNLMHRMTSHFGGSLNSRILLPGTVCSWSVCPVRLSISATADFHMPPPPSTGCISITKLGLNNALALLLALPAKKKPAIKKPKTKPKRKRKFFCVLPALRQLRFLSSAATAATATTAAPASTATQRGGRFIYALFISLSSST